MEDVAEELCVFQSQLLHAGVDGIDTDRAKDDVGGGVVAEVDHQRDGVAERQADIWMQVLQDS